MQGSPNGARAAGLEGELSPAESLRCAGVSRGRRLTFTFNGRAIAAYEGETVAAALLAAGQRVFRRSPRADEPRGLFCGMGVCFDCLVRVDGCPNQRACQTPVAEGMRVETQFGNGSWEDNGSWEEAV